MVPKHVNTVILAPGSYVCGSLRVEHSHCCIRGSGVLSGENVRPSDARALIYVRNATGVVIDGITILHAAVRAIRAYGSRCTVTNVKVRRGRGGSMPQE